MVLNEDKLAEHGIIDVEWEQIWLSRNKVLLVLGGWVQCHQAARQRSNYRCVEFNGCVKSVSSSLKTRNKPREDIAASIAAANLTSHSLPRNLRHWHFIPQYEMIPHVGRISSHLQDWDSLAAVVPFSLPPKHCFFEITLEGHYGDDQ